MIVPEKTVRVTQALKTLLELIRSSEEQLNTELVLPDQGYLVDVTAHVACWDLYGLVCSNGMTEDWIDVANDRTRDRFPGLKEAMEALPEDTSSEEHTRVLMSYTSAGYARMFNTIFQRNNVPFMVVPPDNLDIMLSAYRTQCELLDVDKMAEESPLLLSLLGVVFVLSPKIWAETN